MARTRFNPRLAKVNRSYTVEEIARLFDVHRNTVWNWIKGGLPTVDEGKPALVQGAILRAFLEGRRKAAKRPCPPGTLYCFKCREHRPPALGMAEFIARETGAGNLTALCAACETVMNRRAREDALATILPGIEIRIRRAAGHIAECPSPSLNCA